MELTALAKAEGAHAHVTAALPCGFDLARAVALQRFHPGRIDKNDSVLVVITFYEIEGGMRCNNGY